MTTTTVDPGIVWETCRRGHSLLLHGRPRSDKPHLMKCRACHREWNREFRERNRDLPEYGWKGREHVCSVLYEACAPDESAVLRFMSGDVPERFHRTDKIEAIIRLNKQGLSSAQIARRVQCSSRTVVRVRARLREETQHGQTG